jgi:hypothetical protein
MRIGGRRTIDGCNQSVHDVVHIGEVALHAALAIDVDRLALEHGLGELEERHVGAAPGAIDGEEPKACGRNAEQVGIGVRHGLIGELAGGVEGDRAASWTLKGRLA